MKPNVSVKVSKWIPLGRFAGARLKALIKHVDVITPCVEERSVDC